jgi:hypothetical protein
VRLEFLVDRFEFGPKSIVHESFGNPCHDGGIALSIITVRPDVVTPQQRHQQLPGPAIVECESVLDRGIDLFVLPDLLLDPLTGAICRLPLPFVGRPGMQRFDKSEFFE